MENKIIKNISLIISGILSPLLMPTYGMILALTTSTLYFMPFNVKLSVVLMVAAITFLLPLLALALLYRMGYISGFALVHREERFVPFAIAISSYVALVLYLARAGAPSWLLAFIVGAIVAALVACVVTRWWKISIHTTSISGVFAMICHEAQSDYATGELLPLATIIVLLIGVVASSRLVLLRHTLGQVAAGTICGFACVYVSMLFA